MRVDVMQRKRVGKKELEGKKNHISQLMIEPLNQ